LAVAAAAAAAECRYLPLALAVPGEGQMGVLTDHTLLLLLLH
jgi:hypothetical protein